MEYRSIYSLLTVHTTSYKSVVGFRVALCILTMFLFRTRSRLTWVRPKSAPIPKRPFLASFGCFQVYILPFRGKIGPLRFGCALAELQVKSLAGRGFIWWCAGTPMTRVFGATSRTTTLPAPITLPCPSCTPCITVAPAPT